MNLQRFLAILPLAVGVCGAAQPGGELRLSIAGDPKTFDPLQVTEENSEILRYLTGGTLLRIDRVTDELKPQLAESWTVDKNGKSIVFHLRPGLKYSDGTPLTAADVARTLKLAFDPKNASPSGDAFHSESGLPVVEVTSPEQIVIRYTATKAGLDRLFDELYIAPPGNARPDGARGAKASAGPFFVSEYRPGEAVLLKRNPNFPRPPALESIRLDIQPNRDIETARFLRGEIDLIRKVDPENFGLIAKRQPAAARNLGPSMDSEFLWFNQAPPAPGGPPEWKRKWFTSASFRHAVSAAIDREDLSRIAYKNHAHPAAGPLSPANKFWFNAELKPLRFDPASALSSLQRDGFALRDGVLRDKDGHAVEFSLITNSGNRTREALGALIQADLNKIGIRVNIVTLDFGSLIERIAKTGQYEACLLGFTNMAVDPMDQMNIWLSSGAQHAWWPSQKSPVTEWEARIDKLVLGQASEPSRELRRKAFNEMQRIFVEQEPVIYLVNPDFLTAVAPRVQGFGTSALFPQSLATVESIRLQ